MSDRPLKKRKISSFNNKFKEREAYLWVETLVILNFFYKIYFYLKCSVKGDKICYIFLTFYFILENSRLTML